MIRVCLIICFYLLFSFNSISQIELKHTFYWKEVIKPILTQDSGFYNKKIILYNKKGFPKFKESNPKFDSLIYNSYGIDSLNWTSYIYIN